MDDLLNIREEVQEVEDLLGVLEVNNIHIRRYKKRISSLEFYIDAELRRKCRMRKQTSQIIIDLLSEHLQVAHTRRGLPISAEVQTLAALRYFAKGSDQDEISVKHRISQSTLSRIIKRVVEAICQHRADFIKYPNQPAEITLLKQQFYQIAGCPGIVGAIDCTHIQIKNPGVRDQYPLQFHNRKGFYSLNVVTDAQRRILDIVARWRGTVHDARIWQQSTLKGTFERGEIDGILVGDSGYSASKYLLTPLLNTQTDQEHRYNRAQIRTRNFVERLFGTWKNIFRSFFNGLQIDLLTAKNAIVALAIVHNICLNEEGNQKDYVPDEDNVDMEIPPDNIRGNAFRQMYINRYF